MKQPRIDAFNPNAAPPLGSPMDELPRIERPAPVTVRPPLEPVVPRPAPLTQTHPNPPPASMQASKHESKPARLQAILRERATNAATHRYPPGVLERLNKLHYAFFMEFGIEISKNSIAVLALAYILSDLEEKKDKSEFYSFLVKE